MTAGEMSSDAIDIADLTLEARPLTWEEGGGAEGACMECGAGKVELEEDTSADAEGGGWYCIPCWLSWDAQAPL